jgi:ABC-type lipoprotein release transport system permease subunit
VLIDFLNHESIILDMNPTFWIKTALLFLFRSKRITLALGLMIFFAVATLVFISSIAVGINDSMIINSTGLYSGQITGTHLPDTVTRQTLLVDGVSNVLQRFQIPGTLHYQGKNEMLTLIAVNPDQELKSTSLWKKIIRGKYIKDNKFEILISHDTAKQLAIDPGEKVIFNSGSSVYQLIVVGIYKTGMNRFDRGIAFSPISILPDQTGNWDCAIFLNPGADIKKFIDFLAFKIFISYFIKTCNYILRFFTLLF